LKKTRLNSVFEIGKRYKVKVTSLSEYAKYNVKLSPNQRKAQYDTEEPKIAKNKAEFSFEIDQHCLNKCASFWE